MAQNALLDFLQAASNAAASNVSGPIDLLAMGLRKAGVPVPQNALLGSQWMAERGLTKQPQNALANMAGETAGLLAPVAAAAKAPQIARGLLQAGDNLAAPRTMNPQMGAIDIDAISSVIEQNKQRLLNEANDWATRGYKRNDRVVQFEGDGPGPEGMRISAINEGRRNANVENRMAQVRALNTLKDNVAANPARVEAIYNQAAANAIKDLPIKSGMSYEDLLDVYIGQSLAGLKDWTHGPGSVGGALRRAIESGIKRAETKTPPAVAGADDYLTQLFGGGQ